MGGGIFTVLWSFLNRLGVAPSPVVGSFPSARVASRSPVARVPGRSLAAQVQPRRLWADALRG
jgi:hypothetical protein